MHPRFVAIAVALYSNLCLVGIGHSASPANMNSSSPPMHDSTLVIFGASYAKGWQPTITGLRVVNSGVGGDETRVLLERFDRDVVAHSPRAVVIWGFINDIFRSQGPIERTRDMAYANTVTLVNRSFASGIVPVLATEVPITTPDRWSDRFMGLIGRLRGRESYQTHINSQVRIVNERLRRLARERGILLLDFEKTFGGSDGYRMRAYATEDGSHISAAGYEALTQYAAPLLAQLAKNK